MDGTATTELVLVRLASDGRRRMERWGRRKTGQDGADKKRGVDDDTYIMKIIIIYY